MTMRWRAPRQKGALRFVLPRLRLALPEVIVARTQGRPGGRARALEVGLGRRDHPAIRAHADGVQTTVGGRVHPVLAGERRGDALDHALDAERLAATDAVERLFLLEHP